MEINDNMAPFPLPSKRFFLSCSVIALLAGCATQQSVYVGDTVSGPRTSMETETLVNASDPLLDAPLRATMTCNTDEPITVLRRIKEVSFSCPDIDVSATLDEIRDAGWRVISLSIGNDIENENHVGFPVSITVRKLF